MNRSIINIFSLAEEAVKITIVSSIFLSIIAISSIKFLQMRLIKRKSFWKMLDYIWISIAVCSLYNFYLTARIKDVQFYSSSVRNEISQAMAEVDSTIDLFMARVESGSDQFQCHYQIGRHKRPGDDDPQKLSLCDWLTSVHESIRQVPIALGTFDRTSRNVTKLFQISNILTDMMYLAELNPLSPKGKSIDEIKNLFGGLNRDGSKNVTMNDEYDLNKFGFEVIKNAALNTSCEIGIEEDESQKNYDLIKKYHHEVNLIVKSYCDLRTKTIEMRFLSIDLEDLFLSSSLPDGGWWPYLLAFGIAIRFARTSAEAFLDFREGK